MATCKAVAVDYHFFKRQQLSEKQFVAILIFTVDFEDRNKLEFLMNLNTIQGHGCTMDVSVTSFMRPAFLKTDCPNSTHNQ
jgi:hypothetical protein